MPVPKDALKSIQSWLTKRFGSTYKNTGDMLSHGDQDNFTDCGILAANTAAHDIFADKLWSPEMKALHRVMWFVNLSEAHIDYVRTLHFLPVTILIPNSCRSINLRNIHLMDMLATLKNY